eukprot:2500035-Rhodomonas_salina.1
MHTPSAVSHNPGHASMQDQRQSKVPLQVCKCAKRRDETEQRFGNMMIGQRGSWAYVGSEWVVGREVSKQPPWSMAMSTATDPGRIPAIISRVTSFGAALPWKHASRASASGSQSQTLRDIMAL